MSQDSGDGGRMKMSQLASASGLTVSTIKFYMSQGLLPRPEKSKPNVAYYNEEFLKRLLIVKKMRDEGLSVHSIKAILDKHQFGKVSEWEAFKRQARKKDTRELDEEERLATLSGEQLRRSAILDAAFQVFSVRGYHNATVDDIAQQAGVSKGTCYQYFSGKEEIFLATMDRTMEFLFAEADVAAEGQTNALARLGVKGLKVVSRFKELQFMFFGLYTEVLAGNERLKEKAGEIFDSVATYVAKDIDLGIEQGLFRKIDPMNLGYTMVGIAQAVGNLSITNEDFEPVEYFLGLMDFMRHGMLKNS